MRTDALFASSTKRCACRRYHLRRTARREGLRPRPDAAKRACARSPSSPRSSGLRPLDRRLPDLHAHERKRRASVLEHRHRLPAEDDSLRRRRESLERTAGQISRQFVAPVSAWEPDHIRNIQCDETAERLPTKSSSRRDRSMLPLRYLARYQVELNRTRNGRELSGAVATAFSAFSVFIATDCGTRTISSTEQSRRRNSLKWKSKELRE